MKTLNTLRTLLIGTGATLLLVWAALGVDSRLFQSRLDRQLESARSGAGDAKDESRGARTEATDLVGRIEIPRVGISAMVMEGITPAVLRRAAGHVPGTARPGERGNAGIAGHRDTHFRKLKDVEPGDRIRFTTGTRRIDYRVDTLMIVRPDRGDLLRDAGDQRLTLVTCYPFHYVGPAPERFVVIARPVRPWDLIAGRAGRERRSSKP